MTTPNRSKVFIEKIMPVELLNQQVYYENGGNPFKGLHRWYSRKPLSFSRASVLASLLPADISMDEFEYLLGLERRQYRSKEVRLYKTPPTSERIQQVHDWCEKVWGKRTPTVLDAFAGGGSIPFEAARYGLNVLASDLNPVAVVTMKAAMEYPLKFGPDLQQDIDKWVKWVGDEAEKRLAEFFPSLEGERVQNYLWAHTVVCPSCESVVPLSPNWWLSKTSNYAGKGKERKVTSDWYAVKPIPNPENKRVDFELVKGRKGKGKTIIYENNSDNNGGVVGASRSLLGDSSEQDLGQRISEPNLGESSEQSFGESSEQDARTPKNRKLEYDPDTTTTMSRGVGKCPNCGSVIEDEVIKSQAQSAILDHQLYAVAFRKGKGSLEFRIPTKKDIEGWDLVNKWISGNFIELQTNNLVPSETIINDHGQILNYCQTWSNLFNPRQLLTLITYVEIINEAKSKLQAEYEPEKAEAIATYLGLVLDRCVDKNCRLSMWDSSRASYRTASGMHALNLMWNYPEVNGATELWQSCLEDATKDYTKLCQLFGTKPHSTGLPGLDQHDPKSIQIEAASADSLFHISDNSIDAVITDPPYYGTVPYADLADFFYVWMKRTLGDIFPELFLSEICDRDREAVANPSRFRNMGISADELANQDYEAKMALAFSEYYRVLRDDGVMTVQFNHKDSGAWDVLAKSLIDAGFEITASWAVSTENPQNLHQAKKNSVSSTVLLVCRKRDSNAAQAWWDDLKIEVANILESPDYDPFISELEPQQNQPNLRKSWAERMEENGITGIDLYLSAFGPALNVFSRSHPILDSSGEEVRPEQAFAEARKAIANYRFQKLVQTDTAGFDPLTQWYLLAWDAFKAREFPFDEARQLALAIGGFNVTDLAKTHKLLDSTSGTCKLLSPQQRLKKRAFSVNEQEFSVRYLVDGLHAILAIYTEEQSIQLVRRFMKNTGLVSNNMFMKTMEVAFKVIPDSVSEHKALLDLWLAMDEIKAKVVVEQIELPLEGGQLSLDLPI
jgi:adenine-specific DNA methylase